jgi:hypothetical protein
LREAFSKRDRPWRWHAELLDEENGHREDQKAPDR